VHSLVGAVEGDGGDGDTVGFAVGSAVGIVEGNADGNTDGTAVGTIVGANVTHTFDSQRPKTQSLFVTHFWPIEHAGHIVPPQSESLSSPFKRPSRHDAAVGWILGRAVGADDGSTVGTAVGKGVDASVGVSEGFMEGTTVSTVGLALGTVVGESVGVALGIPVGGWADGNEVGDNDGACVGGRDGLAVWSQRSQLKRQAFQESRSSQKPTLWLIKKKQAVVASVHSIVGAREGDTEGLCVSLSWRIRTTSAPGRVCFSYCRPPPPPRFCHSVPLSPRTDSPSEYGVPFLQWPVGAHERWQYSCLQYLNSHTSLCRYYSHAPPPSLRARPNAPTARDCRSPPTCFLPPYL
jgi:hypothetical protein